MNFKITKRSKINFSRKINFVVYPVVNLKLWTTLPLICYYIDGPLKKRYMNYKELYGQDIEIMDFIALDDKLQFETEFLTWKEDKYQGRIKKNFVNDGTIKDLELKIAEFDPLNDSILRPKWPRYFMKLAHIVATRSNCMK